MKLEELMEAREQLGLVITHDKENNKFENVELVDMKTQNIISDKPGHTQNVFKHLVKELNDRKEWDALEPFLKKHYKAKKLGSDWGDIEYFDITMYGPFTTESLVDMAEDFLEEQGHDLRAEREEEGEAMFGKEQWKREREH